jgi:hypothetical protein
MNLAEIQRRINNSTSAEEVLETTDVIHDETLDLAIRITNELVLEGVVKDCTDTNDSDEFIVQDTIQRYLMAFITDGQKMTV